MQPSVGFAAPAGRHHDTCLGHWQCIILLRPGFRGPPVATVCAVDEMAMAPSSGGRQGVSLVETLTLTASDIGRCLSPAECRPAVERAFAQLAERQVPAARAVAFEAPRGSFHAKVALYDAGRPRF